MGQLTMPKLQRGRKQEDFIEERTFEFVEILLILQMVTSNAALVSSAVTIVISTFQFACVPSSCFPVFLTRQQAP